MLNTMGKVLQFTLLSVLAVLTPSAWAACIVGAAVGLMAETLKRMEKNK